MKFEVDESDPQHDQIEKIFGTLVAADLLSGLIEKTKDRLNPNVMYELTPEVIIGAMRRWLRGLEKENQQIEDYNPQEIAEGIEDNIGSSIRAATAKPHGHDGKQGGSEGHPRS